MPKLSAGILLFRHLPDVEVLLGHPGGPFWARKDEGAWSIPKGEVEPGEEERAAAAREFREETGADPPSAPWLELGEVVQPGRKRVVAFAAEGELDPARLAGGTFEMEWPPRSGRLQSFPEIDRVAWFGLAEARRKILAGQAPLIDRLADLLGVAD